MNSQGPGDRVEHMYLFFDTETTGVPRNYKAPLSDLDNWPRLVQLAWSLCDETGAELAGGEHIVRPDGFVIPAGATRVHGITTGRALSEGVALTEALDALIADMQRARLLVAHNMPFDEKIVGAEFLRSGYPNHLETKPRCCTMQAATDYCQLPGRYGYKWPSLQELHGKLFGEAFPEAHHALADVRACARCFFELKRLNILA